jgi:hypothetical protein
VSVQCSCILQTRGVPFWPWSYHSQEPAALRCRYNVVVFYKHEGCRRGRDRTTIQLHCTYTLRLQVLGNGTITATTAPLGVVEYNYIVPTTYSCRFLGVVRSRPRRPPRICRIQLHCTDTLQLQGLGSGMITVTTEPLMFVEYNYIVPTLYSCRFLGVVRSRPRRHPRGGPLWPWSYHSQEPAAVKCRYNVVVFYKHEGCRRGRDRTTPKNLQL